jgi:hypothetical protein
MQMSLINAVELGVAALWQGSDAHDPDPRGPRHDRPIPAEPPLDGGPARFTQRRCALDRRAAVQAPSTPLRAPGPRGRSGPDLCTRTQHFPGFRAVRGRLRQHFPRYCGIPRSCGAAAGRGTAGPRAGRWPAGIGVPAARQRAQCCAGGPQHPRVERAAESGERGPDGYGFSQTDTWEVLSAAKGERDQSAQRSVRRMPASSPIKSNSDGQMNRCGVRKMWPLPPETV